MKMNRPNFARRHTALGGSCSPHRSAGTRRNKPAKPALITRQEPTLIAWSRKHQFAIQNLKAIELEVLGEKWLASTTERVNALGEQLRQVEAELAPRNLGGRNGTP
jgi:hypothetical protein